MIRYLFIFLVPLLGWSGLFQDFSPDAEAECVLVFLSAVTAALDRFASGPAKKCKMFVIFFVCIMLYGVQFGVLMFPRIMNAAANTAASQHMHYPRFSAALAFSKLRKKVSVPSAISRGPGSLLSGEQHWVHVNDTASFGGQLLATTKTMRTISIVLPCAEEGEMALNTVERFCRRTPDEQLSEIIVVDDGSNPPMSQIFEKDARRLDKDPRCRLRILRHDVTTGLMAAKLTGGKAATGDVVAFFDCHCSPKDGWQTEILSKVTENPRRMVVPAITDLDLDTFDEKVDSAVNAKCYLTFDADFKWFDDESDYIPTISGGLVAMGREWFNLTGGFDEQMHGWGGENLDQSLRAWLCGGEIMRAKSSRIAHMWRTGDPRTRSRYHIKASATDNRGRCAAAWFDVFLPVYRGTKLESSSVRNYDVVKQRLGCKPFSYFLYRFRKVYIEGGVIAKQVFSLKDMASGLCLTRTGGTTKGVKCEENYENQQFQLGNVDRTSGTCCSGLRMYQTNDCLDYFDRSGPHWYSCDVTGQNGNQQYRMREDGRIERENGKCMLMDDGGLLQETECIHSTVFNKVFTFAPTEWEIYRKELELHRYEEELPDLLDN